MLMHILNQFLTIVLKLSSKFTDLNWDLFLILNETPNRVLNMLVKILITSYAKGKLLKFWQTTIRLAFNKHVIGGFNTIYTVTGENLCMFGWRKTKVIMTFNFKRFKKPLSVSLCWIALQQAPV